jgi:hypothetical protein
MFDLTCSDLCKKNRPRAGCNSMGAHTHPLHPTLPAPGGTLTHRDRFRTEGMGRQFVPDIGPVVRHLAVETRRAVPRSFGACPAPFPSGQLMGLLHKCLLGFNTKAPREHADGHAYTPRALSCRACNKNGSASSWGSTVVPDDNLKEVRIISQTKSAACVLLATSVAVSG